MFFALLPFLGFSQGIQFEHDSPWADLLSRAKKENKLIFVDAYATWCGPCKMMAKNVFTDPSVGDYYNAAFVNAKIDMEKGEGPELAQKYGIRAYPTFLYVNGDGELVHSGLGYMEAASFIELGKSAGNPEMQFGNWKKRWEKGERSPDFLYDFTAKVQENDPYDNTLLDAVSTAYLAGQNDWLTQKNAEYLVSYVTDADSKGFDFILKKTDAIAAAVGQERLDRYMSFVITRDLSKKFPKFYETGDVTALETYTAGRYPAKYADPVVSQLKLDLYQTKEDWKAYAGYAPSYVEKYAWDDPNTLNQIAWTYFESVSDKKQLQQALTWALRSVELESGYPNNDTVAALYYKLKKYKDAKEWAEKAIALAKATGEDFSGTTPYLTH